MYTLELSYWFCFQSKQAQRKHVCSKREKLLSSSLHIWVSQGILSLTTINTNGSINYTKQVCVGQI